MNQLSHSFANRILPAIFLIFLSSGILAQTQTFSSSGTFTVPAGVTSITVQAWGGGGGGGQSAGNRARGGGGGGAFTGGTLSVSPGDVLTITVGGGGPAGSNGGNSSVGAIVANGGFADNSGPGGLGGAASAIALPVTASIAGGTGGDGYTAANNGGGGGGGSAASSSLPGTVGTAGNSGGTGGAGGNSPLTNPQGDGGRGADNDGSPGAGNGTAPGGGGGGQSDDDEDGGDGANGQVILTWTCSDNINNMSTTATTPVCTNGTSTVTVTSTSLADGTYTVYYNLSGANTATAQSASMTFSGVTGTFATIPFVNSGATTITITSVGCANVVTGQDFTAAVTVNGAPATPGAISGTTPVCSDQTGLIYSISAVSGATTYNWTVPTGWSITAGSGTISITVTSGSADQSGTIAVTATNTCGTSAASSLAVDLIDNIGFGNTSTNTLSICEGTTGTTINGAGAPSSPTYNWQVSTTSPSSGFSTASNGTNNDEDYTVDNDYYDNPGTYYFRRVISSSTTACDGISDVVTLTVNANPAPVISVDESSGTPDDGTICNGVSVTLDAGSFSSYSWSPGGATSQTINVSPSSTTTYSVTVTNAAGCSGTDNQVITVNPVPVINSISATPPSISCGGSSVLTVVPANNATQTFAQNTTITIPNFGNASPFPSTISVSGLPTSGVSLQNVVFNNLSHEDPDDMDIYLIGPNNQVIWIMSDAGGGTGINNFDLIYADGGTALSTSTLVNNTTYAPDDLTVIEATPGGATLITMLAGFSGNMNGTWSLYIVDDSNDSNSGDLEDWFLTFTYADYTYAWSNGPTTSSQTVMPTATTTYTVTVTTPGTGCSSTANVTVTVTDTEPPMISCPSNISVNNDTGQCCAVVNYTAPVGTDNCTGQTTAQTAGQASGFCFPVGMTTNTFTVTAANSQTASCSFTVTVSLTSTPEVGISGNAMPIADGDAVPGPGDDHTIFGDVGVGNNLVRTFTVHNTGNAALLVSSITSDNPLFTIGIGPLTPASPIPIGMSATFTVTFMPTAAGVQNATITINNDDCDEAVYDFAVTGTGLEPAKALHFDGTGPSDNVNSPAITAFGTQPVTIEFWAKNQSSFTFPVGFANSYLFMFNSGTFVIRKDFVGDYNTGASVSNTGTVWEHFALTYDGVGTFRAYKNGLPTPNPTFSGFSGSGATGTLQIGEPKGGYPFTGAIDEMRMWSEQRTDAQILASYNTEIASMSPCLLVYWKFNQGFIGANNSGITTAIDAATAVNHDGTLTNFALIGSTGNWVAGAGISETTSTYTPAPEINLQGNSMNILDEDLTPGPGDDHTNFGTVVVGNNFVRTFTIQNTGTADLIVSGISSNNALFTFGALSPASPVPAGMSATFTVIFTPTAAGVQNAIITVNNNDCDEAAYNFAVTGNGCVAPSFSACPTGPVTANTAAGLCTAVVTYTVTAVGTPTPTLTYAFTGATTGSGSGTGSGATFNTGNTTVTVTATSSCGSPATCVFTVTVTDNQPPAISCPSNISVNNDPGQCCAVVNYTAPVGTDNCPGQSTAQTAGQASIFCFPVGVTTNTFVVTAANGQTASCSFTVTVADNEDPTFQDNTAITLYDQDFESPNITPIQDGCFLDLSLNQGVNPLYGPGWQQKFTVETILINGPQNVYTDPTLQGGNYAIGMLSTAQDDRLTYTFDAQDKNYLNVQFDLSAIDLKVCSSFGVNTPIMRLRLYDSPGGIFNINSPGTLLDQTDLTGIVPGATNYTFNWATVAAGLDASSSTDGNVTLMFDLIQSGYASFDNLLITASNVGAGIGCPVATISVQCLTDVPAAPVLEGFDNCDPDPVVTYGETVVVSNPNDRVITRTWTVTDDAGNSNSCTQTVTVLDTQAPTITCPSAISVNNNPGQCCAVVNYTAPIGTDNCTGQTTAQTAGQASGFCFPVGVTTNTFVVTAANSQTATCSFTVTVTDNTPPAITCPSNISVNNDPGQCCAVVNYTAPVGTDNCTGQSTAQTAGQASGFCFPVGVTTNTFVVTAANSQTASCSFTVTVTDNEDPVVTCPGNVSVDCSDDIDPFLGAQNVTVYSEDFSDNSAGWTLGTEWQIGAATASSCGSGCTGTDPADDHSPTADDGVAGVVIGGCAGTSLHGYYYLTSPPINVASVTGDLYLDFWRWLVSDYPNYMTNIVEVYNGASWQTVWVQTVSNCIMDAAWTNQNFNVTAYKNAGFRVRFGFQIGSSGVYTVPSWNLDDVTLYTIGTGGANPLVGAATATDNCDPDPDIDYSDVITTGACPEEYSVARTWTATDGSNNTGMCTQTILVEDNTNPTITCPSNITSANDPGQCCAVETFLAPTTSDDCSTVSLTQTAGLGSGSCFPIGLTTNTFVATDACNNTATCSFTVTVTDNQPPSIICPSNISVNNDPGQCCAVVNYTAPVGTDNCPGQTTAQTAGQASGFCFPVGVTTNTFVVTAANSQTATCSFTVTVTDNQPPAITCPSNISVNNDPGQCCAVVNYTAPVGTDNCPGQTTAQTAGQASGFCFPVGVTTNTFVVTAANSQTATCSFTVTVTDNEAPMISCPSNISVNNDPGQCCAVVNYTAPIGTDNCPGQSTAQTAGQASGFCFPVGVTTNTFVVTAANSQTATCSFTVTVTDNEPPAISCPSNVSVNNDPGVCCAVVNYTAPVGTDNCTGQSTAQTAGQASGFCFPVGVTTNTFVVTAANSQTATCSFTVTVTDNQNPNIATCPVTRNIVGCGIGDITGPAYSSTPAASSYAEFSNGTNQGVGNDNCGITSVSYADAVPTGFCPVVVIRTWTLSDGVNSVSCNQTINIKHTAAPGEVGGPVMTTSTVSCPADAVPPPVLPVVEDVCGNTIPAPVPIITNDLFPAGCVGMRTYTYTYLDNCASQIFIWAYVYTIDYSSGLTPPASTMSTVSCPALASNPGPPANITDACGRTVSAALVGSTSTPDPVTCEGQVVWTYRYTACDGTTTADWTHTYTIDYSGGLTPPMNTISTVACATLASNPGPPANITDACGRTVSAVLVGSTSTPDPVTCEGTVEWRYRYTACDGTTTADWTHTYTIDNNIPPVITLQGDASLVICKGDTYVDAGATASDDCQGNITPGVVTVNPVNTAVAGIYTVTYDVTDCAGNPALQVSRTVQVIEPLAVTPSAPSEMFCSQGSSTITVALGADSDAFNVSANLILGTASGYTPSQTNLPGGSLLDPAAISNTGGTDAVIEYTITPYHYGYDGQNDNGGGDDCAGPETVVTITIKPEPVGANQSIPICSGGVLSIDLQGIINAYGNGLASSFSWAAANNNDVNGENTLPTAGGLINNQLTLVNPGNGPQIVIYTVTSTGLNGCPGMSFTVEVVVAACEVSIIDPCTCLDNATTLVNGQFSETIQVDGPAGDSWTVVLAPGLYQMASLAPPAAPLPVAAGTPLAEGPPGVYTLAGKHIDALGYSISVTNGSVTLSTSNTCYYPNPSLSGLNDVYCSQDGAQVATVSAQLGDGSGPATVENILFELIRQSDNTVVASQSGVANTFNFNPSALAQGHYTLRATFDGADDGVGHPGCEQAVEESFEVRKVGCGVFPWNGN